MATTNVIRDLTPLIEAGLLPPRPLINPTHQAITTWLLTCRDELVSLATGAGNAAHRAAPDATRASEHLADAREYLDLVDAIDALRVPA